MLIVSQYVEQAYAAELLADGRGGIGYLLKDRIMDVDEFVDAVRRVAGGGTALDPEVVAQLFARHEPGGPIGTLTPRESEVLALMAEGRSNAAIARELVLTVGAVEKHMANILISSAYPRRTTITGAFSRCSPIFEPERLERQRAQAAGATEPIVSSSSASQWKTSRSRDLRSHPRDSVASGRARRARGRARACRRGR